MTSLFDSPQYPLSFSVNTFVFVSVITREQQESLYFLDFLHSHSNNPDSTLSIGEFDHSLSEHQIRDSITLKAKHQDTLDSLLSLLSDWHFISVKQQVSILPHLILLQTFSIFDDDLKYNLKSLELFFYESINKFYKDSLNSIINRTNLRPHLVPLDKASYPYADSDTLSLLKLAQNSSSTPPTPPTPPTSPTSPTSFVSYKSLFSLISNIKDNLDISVTLSFDSPSSGSILIDSYSYSLPFSSLSHCLSLLNSLFYS